MRTIIGSGESRRVLRSAWSGKLTASHVGSRDGDRRILDFT